MKKQVPSVDDFLRSGLAIVKTIVEWGNLNRSTQTKDLDPEQPDFKDLNNLTRHLDILCHDYARNQLKYEFGDFLSIYGEEAPTPKSLSRYKRVLAIFDAVDGTDLVARGFYNWCSALAFFDPNEKQILAAVVGHSSGAIYYASHKGVFKKILGDQKTRTSYKRLLRSSKEKLELAQASVCFYGQKPPSFLENSFALSFILEEFQGRMLAGEYLPFRVYNLGGNPMMVKIPERTVDIVFETRGQKAHDVVPGAYIATKAGAVLIDLDGNPVDLVEALLNPHKRLTYILAATTSLAIELKNKLRRKTDIPIK